MVSTPRISIGPAGCHINRDYDLVPPVHHLVVLYISLKKKGAPRNQGRFPPKMAGGPVKSEVGYSMDGVMIMLFTVGDPCDPSLAPHHP